MQLDVLVEGVFEKRRFLDYVMNFITFEDDGKTIAKKAAAYHQYWAVNKAVACTVEASQPGGDQRIGVVWHTQGSGKSLSMAFYGGKIIKHPAMENPTLVVITDRNDLDDQLFGTFSTNSELFRQKPVQAESRDHLKELLRVASGGVVFTTLQKFMPSATAPSPQPSPRGEGVKTRRITGGDLSSQASWIAPESYGSRRLRLRRFSGISSATGSLRGSSSAANIRSATTSWTFTAMN